MTSNRARTVQLEAAALLGKSFGHAQRFGWDVTTSGHSWEAMTQMVRAPGGCMSVVSLASWFVLIRLSRCYRSSNTLRALILDTLER